VSEGSERHATEGPAANLATLDDQRDALSKMRVLVSRFVSGEIEVADFVPPLGSLFAPFDPPDLSTTELTDAERTELWFYIDVKGGWFGETAERIPRRGDWVYGRDTSPYSWIDGPAYRRWIVSAASSAGVRLPEIR
jgi:hypothetical protein